MRIGILTYHCVPNFGAQLQAISTCGYLKRNGHTPIVLHWYPQDLEDMYAKRIPKEQIEEHRKFTEAVLPLSNLCRTEQQLVEEIDRQNLDAIIVGSDALFKYEPIARRKRFNKRKLRFEKINVLSVMDCKENPFFCDFYSKLQKKIPVYAFSVSSQNCPYKVLNNDERRTLAAAMSNFKSITVRDSWTAGMVEFLIGKKDSPITPDPVFSFNQNCYLEAPSREKILKKFNLPDNYVLFSFGKHYQKESYIRQLEQVFVDGGYTPYALPMPEGCFDFGMNNRIDLPLSPLDWYCLIKYSNGYVGERMHPIVVALHNAVPFFCFDEYGAYKRYLGGLIKKQMASSSKTRHIVEKADLAENLCSYKTDSLPNVSSVLERIKSFNVGKCKQFSMSIQYEYETAMKSMLS